MLWFFAGLVGLLLCVIHPCMAQYSQTFMGGELTLGWSLSNSSILSINASVITSGWVGVGFGTSMVGSQAVIGWVSSEGAAQIALYDLNGQTTSSIAYSSPQTIFEASVSETGGVTTISFQVPAPATDSLSVILAYGSQPAISMHSQDATATIGLSTGTATASGPDTTAVRRQAHAVMMTLAFGVGFPVGTLAARYMKGFADALWFQTHRAIQIVSVLFAIVAFLVIVADVSATQGQHFGGDGVSHKIVGLVAVLFTFLQPINAALRPKPDAAMRISWLLSHRLQALCVYVFGLAALALGFQLGVDYGVVTSSQSVSAIVVVFVAQAVLIVLGVIFQYNGGNKPKELELPKSEVKVLGPSGRAAQYSGGPVPAPLSVQIKPGPQKPRPARIAQTAKIEEPSSASNESVKEIQGKPNPTKPAQVPSPKRLVEEIQP